MALLNKLKAAGIKAASVGSKLQDGGGLMFQRTEAGGKWTFRYSLNGRRRAMGIGAMPDVSLAAARKARAQWAAVLADGLDPITERQRIRDDKAETENRNDPTFEEMALATFEARKETLRADGKRGRWFSPLRNHVIAKIGATRVSKLHQRDIQDAIAPIWRTSISVGKVGRTAFARHSGRGYRIPMQPHST